MTSDGSAVTTDRKDSGESGLCDEIVIGASGVPIHMRVSRGGRRVDAPAVVLVHGLGLSGRYMMPTAERLARHYEVYVPDLPGFGDSGKPGRALDVAGLSDALAIWMDAVGLARAAFVGNSFGCQIIVDLGVRHPERVARAVLQGPTTDPADRSMFWQFVRWRQNQPYNPKSMGPSTRGDYRKAGAWRLFKSVRHFLHDRIEDKLPDMSAPALVVRGECDPICRQSWAEEVTRLLPHGRLVVLPGVAHTLVYTSAEDLVGACRPFLDAVRSAA